MSILRPCPLEPMALLWWWKRQFNLREESMQSFLNFVDKWLHYAALTLMCVWFVALVFVMRNVQIQDFIVAYGFQTSAMLLAFSIVAHWLAKWHGGLELTEIYRRDAVVNAFVGSATLIFCGLIVSVFPTWLTGVFSLMFATFVLFGVVEVLEACIDWRR